MVYKVIRPFKDMSDMDAHEYAEGDRYPRKGFEPAEDFVNGLLTGSNNAGSIFLVVDEDVEEESGTDEVHETTDEETPVEEEITTEKPKRKRTTKKAEA
ncbi:hypothetical protein DIY18_09315 [Streptococcus iniae]|uniref:hypothetical protein n=1 Tax=Streptococcus iniae TaxID=1346 RepID=UPI000EF814A2|nr:hypothetical protein [Streptococcus iniae]RLU42636.1 hypothetical protein DIY18_09315 [Streptococcus iniae]RMI48136.1 hypothetical protein DIY12_09245 [Streptococcus iniae]